MTTVEKIHHEIDTAQDRLLEQANKIIKETRISPETLIEQKAERLKMLGFNNIEVEVANKKKSERAKKESELVKTKEQADLIQYYKQAYPFMKFLTEEELDRICKKYGLIYAPVDRYKKPIPEKNLIELESCQKIKKEDNAYNDYIHKYSILKWTLYNIDYLTPRQTRHWDKKITLHGGGLSDLRIYLLNKYNTDKFTIDNHKVSEINKQGNFIAAPKSHFNLKGLNKTGLGFFEVFKTEVKDPIVFEYVKGGILVKTKWGEEAEDPALLNEIYN